MKKLTRLYLLGIVLLSSLMLLSCQKESDDIEVHNYSFSAKVEIIDNKGMEFEVGQPIKLRISLDDVKDRGDSIGISFNIGERKGLVYTESRPQRKFGQNVVFNDEFQDNSVILNYIPKNGGEQTIKFILTNGKYNVEISELIKVNTGANISFVPLSPLKQTLGSSSTGKIMIDNYGDEDNYFNVVYDVIGENAPSGFTIFTEEGTKNLSPKDTLRLVSGKETKSFTYYYTLYQEGYSTIKISVIDRYGNEVGRTYELFYSPALEVKFSVQAFSSAKDKDYLEEFVFKLQMFGKNKLGNLEPYQSHSDLIKVEFDMSYVNYLSHARETKHVVVKLHKGDNRATETFKEIYPFAYRMQYREIKFSNFIITGLNDSEGRTYHFDGVLKYQETQMEEKGPRTYYSENIRVQ